MDLGICIEGGLTPKGGYQHTILPYFLKKKPHEIRKILVLGVGKERRFPRSSIVHNLIENKSILKTRKSSYVNARGIPPTPHNHPGSVLWVGGGSAVPKSWPGGGRRREVPKSCQCSCPKSFLGPVWGHTPVLAVVGGTPVLGCGAPPLSRTTDRTGVPPCQNWGAPTRQDLKTREGTWDQRPRPWGNPPPPVERYTTVKIVLSPSFGCVWLKYNKKPRGFTQSCFPLFGILNV